MSFSLTGNILTGSSFRPDIVTFVHRTNNEITGVQSAKTSKLNIAGYIPIVSTVTGLGRSLLGLAHTIAHLVIALFTWKGDHLREAGLGAQNFGRGLVEMVPILGNLAMFINDIRREIKYENIALQYSTERRIWSLDPQGQVEMFACGKFIAKQVYRDVKDRNSTLGTIEEAMYGHINGRVVGHQYLLPENQPWSERYAMFN